MNLKKFIVAALAVASVTAVQAAGPVLTLSPAATHATAAKAPTKGVLVIKGTGESGTFTIDASNLTDKVTLTATSGLEVTPSVLPADAKNVTVRVTLLSTLPEMEGKIIARSGDLRAAMPVKGYGSALQQKDLSANPLFKGEEKSYEADMTGGFTPGEAGYTIEFRAKLNNAGDKVDTWGVTEAGASFKSYVEPQAMGLYNGESKVGFNNPATDFTGGKQQFYNTDGKFHTYRFTVTSDKRVFAYRDGLLCAMLRAADYGSQADWIADKDGVKENLLKNPGFEGEYNYRKTDSLLNKVEGWIVDPIDQYNCNYDVPNMEIDKDLDYFNHVMKLQRYNWNDGWAGGTVSQIVNVAPKQTYSLSFLAQGGMDTKSGTNMSSVKIEEVGNAKKGTSVTITNQEGMEQYGMSYTTSADCQQIKVILYNERFLNGGGWGSSPRATYIDEMVLSGMGVKLDQKVGFAAHSDAEVEYFTYDVTGAYAPLTPVLTPSAKSLTIDGLGKSAKVKVAIANLPAGEKVKVSATSGFSVMPETLDPTKDGEVMVTLNSSLAETKGKLILRAGDVRSEVALLGFAGSLPEKDLKETAAYKGGDEAGFEHFAEDGFTAGENGYTVEFRIDNDKAGNFEAWGVTPEGGSFKTYVEPEAIGLYNGESKVGIANPATAEKGGKSQFYNNDGKAHTYRYSVLPDKRVYIYRDGMQVATLRTHDFGHQADWLVENTPVQENLLKNGNFEGEFNYRESDGQLNKVEGWICDPIDQYNCTYGVPNMEIDNDLDHYNHVMKLQRYNWNDGWAAGTVSQIVNVAPKQTYSLSFLAQGGMDTKSGTNMSSVKIEEVGNAKKGTSVTITNQEGMEQYGMSYTTSADCQQIKVILYNERFLNGGGWGSSPRATYIDEMVLTGVGQKVDTKVGFATKGAKVEYFAYDPTGAYAPGAPSFGTDLSSVEEVAAANRAYAVTNGVGVAVYNVQAGVSVAVYDALGTLVAKDADYIPGVVLALPKHGVYFVAVEGHGPKQTLKLLF